MRLILANPRGFCAGVERAVQIVEHALLAYGPPVYVRHEIVHNHHVLQDLAGRGAVFVEDLDDVPSDSTVVFSAHGVSPAVFAEARERQLRIVDATCPLVTKVHSEVAQHARDNRTVFLIGHRAHPEVQGTLGHYNSAGSARIVVVEDQDEAREVQVEDPARVGYVTQTTLSVDDTTRIVRVLQQRFPDLIAPRRDDICYATQNRQRAVRELAQASELVLVVGDSHSSNSVRLREVVECAGVPAYLLANADQLARAWFEGKCTVGLTSGASAPELLVQQVIERLRDWWPTLVVESLGTPESVHFRLPRGLEPPGLGAQNRL
jgi:4-hydroxy-3-methylbut-2-enyl diphosphate reductase